MRPWLSMAPLPPRSPAGRVKLLMVFQNLAPILIGNLPGVFYTSPGGDLIAGWCRISDASQPNVVKKTFFFQETRACPNCGSSVLAKWVTCQKSICEASVWQLNSPSKLKSGILPALRDCYWLSLQVLLGPDDPFWYVYMYIICDMYIFIGECLNPATVDKYIIYWFLWREPYQPSQCTVRVFRQGPIYILYIYVCTYIHI